jgi:hypothetical protein
VSATTTAAAVAAPTRTGQIEGRVQKQCPPGAGGAARGCQSPAGVPDVTVEVREPAGSLVATVVTDAGGRVAVTVPAGTYDVIVQGTTSRQRVTVSPGGVAIVSVSHP